MAENAGLAILRQQLERSRQQEAGALELAEVKEQEAKEATGRWEIIHQHRLEIEMCLQAAEDGLRAEETAS